MNAVNRFMPSRRTMHPRVSPIWLLSSLALVLTLFGGCMPIQRNAMAQPELLKEQIVGTWTLVSVVEVFTDGRKENSWGPTVTGAASFDGKGRFTFMIIGADLPTPSGRAQVASRMVIAYFGTYSVDEAAKTVTYKIERATFPNYDGNARTANVTVKGDEMTQILATITTPQGKVNPHLSFKRAKS